MPLSHSKSVHTSADVKRAKNVFHADHERLLFYSNVLRHIAESVILIDNDMVIAYLNHWAGMEYGVEPGEAVGKKLTDIFTWQWIDPADEKLSSESLERNGFWQGENIHIKNTGELLYVYSSVTLIKGADGKQAGMLAVISNITKRKDDEKRIRSLARFPEENPYPVLRIQDDNTISYANAAAEPVLNEWRCSLNASVDGSVGCTVQYALKSNQQVDIELRHVDRWFSLSFVPVITVEKQHYVNVYGRDITEAKQAEKALRASEAKLKVLANSKQIRLNETREILEHEIESREEAQRELAQRHKTLEAVYDMATASDSALESICDKIVADIGGILHIPIVVIHHSHALMPYNLTKWDKGAILHGEGSFEMCKVWKKVLQRKKLIHYHGSQLADVRGSTCLGFHDFYTLVGVPILDNAGEVLGAICAMDVTDREFKKSELHLIEIFARYAAHEIIHRILESRILQSRELELLGNITAGIAHEVRNPLHCIMAIMEALFKEIKDHNDFSSHFNYMQKQVQRLSTLMDDLLLLGRPVDAERMEQVFIRTLLRETIRAWHEVNLSNREISLDMGPSASTCSVRVNAAKMQQAFTNILDNAHQHSPDGSPIRIQLQKTTQGTITISFIDFGSGIDPANFSRVFEPFYTTRRDGSGLGMSITRYILTRHGGTIKVYNTPGGAGLSVEVCLPLTES